MPETLTDRELDARIEEVVFGNVAIRDWPCDDDPEIGLVPELGAHRGYEGCPRELVVAQDEPFAETEIAIDDDGHTTQTVTGKMLQLVEIVDEYTTDPAAMLSLWAKLSELGWLVEISDCGEQPTIPRWVVTFHHRNPRDDHDGWADTPMRATAEAALAAMEGKGQ